MKTSWFDRHLNLTLTLVVAFGTLAFTFGGLNGLTPFAVVSLLLAAVAMFSTEIWYLHKKNRSLIYLLLNPLGLVGFVWMLLLENRRDE